MANFILQHTDIVEGIDDLKGKKSGLTILVNRYDGIDLPGDSCRILVIDGLPDFRSSYSLAIQGMNPDDERYLRERIQKIEQGMGRGVRSNNDYCAIIMMGDKLKQVFLNIPKKDRNKFFSEETKAQVEFSEGIWEMILREAEKEGLEVDAAEQIGVIDYILEKDEEFRDEIREYVERHLETVGDNKNSKIDPLALVLRKSFEYECREDFANAFRILEEEKNRTKSPKTQGFLMQLMAEYKNFSDQQASQELLRAAREKNAQVHRPKVEFQSKKESDLMNSQASRVKEHIVGNYKNTNNYTSIVDNILVNLKISEEINHDKFERAIQEIFELIGAVNSIRPEKEFEKGPDNLVIFEESYVVIECKNMTTTDKISKSDNSQLLDSIEWCRTKYGKNKIIPLLIHNSYTFSEEANPNPETRIMTEKELEKFRSAIKKFFKEVMVDSNYRDVVAINKLLKINELNEENIISNYTKNFKKK